jgi:hypothetical protein
VFERLLHGAQHLDARVRVTGLAKPALDLGSRLGTLVAAPRLIHLGARPLERADERRIIPRGDLRSDSDRGRHVDHLPLHCAPLA